MMIQKLKMAACLFFIMVSACIFQAETNSAEDRFVSLFNGKDLSGWIPMGTPDAFVVKNNSIYCTGAGPYPTWMRSEKEYENFILRFEYQTEGWYEGGVLIHAPLDGPGSKIGLKLHLRHDQHEYGLRSPGAIYDAAAPRSIANLPSGQWNRCKIECQWPSLRVTLNGTLIHDIDMDANEAFKYRMRKGFIGLQNIGCHAYFRNIEIQTLPGEEEWTDLFASGLDGLRFLEDADWRIENGDLIGQGKTGYAITKKSYEGPFELQVWVKTAVNGNGGVDINGSDRTRGVEVQCFNAPDSTNPTGSLYGIAPARRIVCRDEEWCLLQIFSDSPRAMVLVNGEKVSESDQLQTPNQGVIDFQQHTPGSAIHYRGARIKKVNWP